jgi:MFS family permease
MPFPEALLVLRNRYFRIYWLGQTVSLVGTWMQQMAQGWVVTRLTSQASALGLLMVAGSLPIVLLGLKGGQLADRYSKRNILIVTQLALMLLAILFATLVFSGKLVLWHVFALAGVLGVVTAFDLPAAQAFAPDLVEPRLIGRAVAMMQAVFHGSRLVGPALAGFLIERFGEGSAFLANGVSFLAVLASLLAIPAAYRPTDNASRRDSSLLGGVRYVRSDAITRALMLLMLWILMFSFPFIIVLMVYYARHVVGADAAGMGAILSASGLGAVTGATVLVFSSTASWRKRLWVGIAGITFGLLGLAANHLLLPAIGLSTLLSLGTSLCMGTIHQAVQQRVPDELRGRVMALFAIAFTSVLPLSGLVLSLLADRVGLPRLMVACGPAFALLATVVTLRLPKTLER